MSVHNHGSEDGPGLACHARRINGELIGDCQLPKSRWEPSMQTGEAAVAVQQWMADTPGRFRNPHDPDFLACLDKGDIISRYQLLLHQHESAMRSAREHHEFEMRRLRATVTSAGKWWDHCRRLAHKGLKTAKLSDMEVAA